MNFTDSTSFLYRTEVEKLSHCIITSVSFNKFVTLMMEQMSFPAMFFGVTNQPSEPPKIAGS